MTTIEGLKLKKGDILVPNGKYKSSLYFNIKKVQEVQVIIPPRSYGDFDGKVIKGSLKRNHYYANGDKNLARLNIKAFKLKEQPESYNIY